MFNIDFEDFFSVASYWTRVGLIILFVAIVFILMSIGGI